MFLESAFIIIAALLALAFIVERVRAGKSESKQTDVEEVNRRLQAETADEALPTETGRFRVRQALARVAKERAEKAAEEEDKGLFKNSREGEPLPDPFSLDIKDSSDKAD